MITFYDYGIIGFYLLFMLAIGLVFRRMSKNTSDYFRAGGAMPWWLTGASAWIFSFSAWTFTGGAGKVYETGTLVLVVFYSTIFALAAVMIFTCVRFRRMRVITWMEAVRRRYGPVTEQFYTWIKLPLLLFFASLSLNAVSVFMSSVFQIDMVHVLIALGVVVTLVAFAGGSWAVLASDFVQMLLVVTITITVAVLVLARPEIGGIGGLVAKVPSAHFHWTELARPQVIALWIMAQLWFKFSDENNIERSASYLMARSDRDARLMVLVPLLGTIGGPLIWFIPSMAATIMHPNLAAEFPLLKQPHEAAFVAVSLDVMPAGLIGLLLCAMLGATVTAMDTGLNRNAGIFIRSLYKPVFRPGASEKHLLVAGKICTLVFGAMIVVSGLLLNRYRQTNLFDLANQLAANLLIPLALPLIYGLFYKRTPGWSSFDTALVGGAASWLLGAFVTPAMFQHLLGWTEPLSKRESTDFLLATTAFGTVVIGTAWYFFTSLFYAAISTEERDRVESFFTDLRTPLVPPLDSGGVQTTIYKLLGALCIVYGVFILLLMLIPNRFNGRLAFLFCGGVILTIGVVLFAASKRRGQVAAVAALPGAR